MPAAAVAETAPDRLRAGRALLILAAFVGTQVVVALMIGVGAGAYHGLLGRPGRPAAVPLAIVAQIAGMTVGAVVAFQLSWQALSASSGPRRLAGIGWSRGSSRALLVAALSGLFLCAFFLIVVIPNFPPRPGRPLGPMAQAVAGSGWPKHAWAVFAVLLAPPIEEFFFRGVLFTGLSRSWGRGLSVLTVSLIFVALHIPESSAYWPALVPIALVTLATMAARIMTSSLGPPIALHMAYNSGLVLCAYAAALAS